MVENSYFRPNFVGEERKRPPLKKRFDAAFSTIAPTPVEIESLTLKTTIKKSRGPLKVTMVLKSTLLLPFPEN